MLTPSERESRVADILALTQDLGCSLDHDWQRELAHKAMEGIESLIALLGEDGNAEVKFTAYRYIKAHLERKKVPHARELLRSVGTVKQPDEPVVVENIRFSSMCKHHLYPFHGYASVAYMPDELGNVVGLSKVARLVEFYASKLQLQEHLTSQIAMAFIDPSRDFTPFRFLARGAIATTICEHGCMSCRGVDQYESKTQYTVSVGSLKDAEALRWHMVNRVGRPNG